MLYPDPVSTIAEYAHVVEESCATIFHPFTELVSICPNKLVATKRNATSVKNALFMAFLLSFIF
jgi:hypothetical protein